MCCSIAASAPYTDKYLLTQMKLVKAVIPGTSQGNIKVRGVFLELEHFGKQSCTTRKRKAP